jgi:hypothetical protein
VQILQELLPLPKESLILLFIPLAIIKCSQKCIIVHSILLLGQQRQSAIFIAAGINWLFQKS